MNRTQVHLAIGAACLFVGLGEARAENCTAASWAARAVGSLAVVPASELCGDVGNGPCGSKICAPYAWTEVRVGGVPCQNPCPACSPAFVLTGNDGTWCTYKRSCTSETCNVFDAVGLSTGPGDLHYTENPSVDWHPCDTTGQPLNCDAPPMCMPGQEQTCCEDDQGEKSVHIGVGEATVPGLRTDSAISSPSGLLGVQRGYSSFLAIAPSNGGHLRRELFPESSLTYLSQSDFGSGWFHPWEYWLIDDPNQFIVVSPNGKEERFTIATTLVEMSGIEHPTVKLIEIVDGFTWLLTDADGTVYGFEKVTGTDYARLFAVQPPSENTKLLTYYDALSDAPCDVSTGPKAGKLCMVEDASEHCVHFSNYGTHGYVTETMSGECSDWATPSWEARTTYTYTASPRIDVTGNVTVADQYLLTGVSHERKNGMSWTEYDSESYEYTKDTYYRPDLTTQFPNLDERLGLHRAFPAVSGVTTSPMTIDAYLLRRQFNHLGEFVEGHEYRQDLRAVTNETAAEFLLFDYVEETSGRRVIVVNESEGSQQDFLFDSAGNMTAADADCCGSSTGAEFEWANSPTGSDPLRAVAKWAQDPSDTPQVNGGTRTTFHYDSDGRVVLEQTNNDTPNAPSVRRSYADALSDGITVMEYDYDAVLLPGVATTESRAYSAVCGDPASSTSPGYSLTCPTFGPPSTVRDFDDDYDQTNPPNQQGALGTTREHQTIQTGVTVSYLDATTTTLAEISYSSQVVYDTAASHPERVERTIDPKGAVTRFTYASDYLATETVDYGGTDEALVRTYSNYNTQGVAEKIVQEEVQDGSSNKLETVLTHDDAGRVTRREVTMDTMKRVWDFFYDDVGRLTETRVGDGTSYITNTTDFATYPTGVEPPTVSSSPNSAFCDSQDPTWTTSQEVGDAQADCLVSLGNLGRPFSTIRGADEESQAMAYNALGALSLQSSYTGLAGTGTLRGRQGFEYDDDGQLIRRFKYTDDGANPDFVQDTYYDRLGRTVEVTDERWATVGDTHAANRDDARRRTIYDKLGRVTESQVGTAADCAGSGPCAKTLYAYDVHGNLREVTAPNGTVTSYVYDDFGRVILVDSPDSGETRYAYDANGNLERKLEADGNLIEMTYDNRNRLLTETFGVGGMVTAFNRTYHYDAPSLDDGSYTCGSETVDFLSTFLGGRLAWVDHEAGATYYSYTPFGEVAAVFEQPGATFNACNLRITRYSYDFAGRLETVTYPSGRKVDYVYVGSELYPSSVSIEEDGASFDLLTGLTYHPGGRVAGYTADAVSFAGSWDLAGQLLNATYSVGGNAEFDWGVTERDGSGNIEGVGDAAHGQLMTAAYDYQDRLDDYSGAGLRGYQDCTYTYDDAGNRLTENCYDSSAPTTTSHYEVVASDPTNRLEELTWPVAACGAPDISRSIARDTVGRATTGWRGRFPLSSYGMTYGLSGRLDAVDADSNATDDFLYDYDHRNLRQAKRDVAAATWDYFTYDASGQLIYEALGSGATREYVYLQGRPVAMLWDSDGDVSTAADVYVLGTDHLGSPQRAFEHDTGATAWAADYEAFGEVVEYVPGSRNAPSISVPIRFPGQYEDAETGLHYNHWRYYDPNSAHYLTPDPIGLRGGDETLFGYVANNPLRWSDPQGLKPGDVFRTRDCAGIDASLWAQNKSLSTGVETAGVIYRLPGPRTGPDRRYTYIESVRRPTFRSSVIYFKSAPPGGALVGAFHSHTSYKALFGDWLGGIMDKAGGGELFSDTDLTLAEEMGKFRMPLYVGTPLNRVKRVFGTTHDGLFNDAKQRDITGIRNSPECSTCD